jgi:hypothetical protein
MAHITSAFFDYRAAPDRSRKTGRHLHINGKSNQPRRTHTTMTVALRG